MALAFTTVPSNWRRVGHIITDKVYERLTGEKGYFDTRIIYVAEEGPKTKRIKTMNAQQECAVFIKLYMLFFLLSKDNETKVYKSNLMPCAKGKSSE